MKLFLIIFFTILLTACCNTTDPTKGGLCGGIGGLSSGNYDKRIEEREKNLAAINKVLDEEKEKNSALESTKAEKEQQIIMLNNEINRMESDIYNLRREITGTTKNREELLARVRALEMKISALKSKPITESSDLTKLEKEKTKLEEEVEMLRELIHSMR